MEETYIAVFAITLLVSVLRKLLFLTNGLKSCDRRRAKLLVFVYHQLCIFNRVIKTELFDLSLKVVCGTYSYRIAIQHSLFVKREQIIKRNRYKYKLVDVPRLKVLTNIPHNIQTAGTFYKHVKALELSPLFITPKSPKHVCNMQTNFQTFVVGVVTDEAIAAPTFEPVSAVIDRIASGTRVSPRESMRYETLRLCSFRTYPTENKPYCIRFAQAGFYYASNNDEVICYSCGKRIGGWRVDDDPLDVHRGVSPNCPFLTHNSMVNVPVTTGNCLPVPNASVLNISSVENHLALVQTSQRSVSETSVQESGVSWEGTETPRRSSRNALQSGQSNIAFASLISATRSRSNEEFHANREFGQTQTLPDQEQNAIASYVEGTVDAKRLSNSSSTIDHDSTSALSQNTTGMSDPLSQQIEGNEGTSENARTGHHDKQPKHPNFATSEARCSSFLTCPNIGVSPAILSEAGFFYAGVEDWTRCFFCGIGLRRWSEDDDPWVEHARFSIDCDFVRRMKGAEFINLHALEYANQGIQDDGNGQFKTQSQLASQNSKQQDTAESNDVDELGGDTTRSSPTQRTHQNANSKRQKIMNVCFICHSNAVCMKFLPCGHIVTCETCAPSVKECIVLQCGKPIKRAEKQFCGQ